MLPAAAQAKLAVGPAGDVYEREADAVADQVVARLRSVAVTPTGGDAASDGHGDAGNGSVASDEGPVRRVRRRAATVGAQGGAVDADTEAAINRTRGGGSPLDPATRGRMETAFGGADFGAVRVHTGATATELNERVQAKAFTLGSDIYLRDGSVDAASSSGQELLAHELTHTIQQGGAVQRRSDRDARAGAVRRVIARSAMLQRLPATTLVGISLHKPDATDPGVIDDTDSGASTITYDPGETMDVDDTQVLVGKESGDRFLRVVGARGGDGSARYVRQASVELPGATATPGPETTGDRVGGAAGKIGDTAGILPDINDAQDAMKANGGSVSSDMESGVGVAAGVGDTITMFTGLAEAIVAFRDPDADGGDKAGAVLTGIAAVGTGTKGVSGAVDKAGAGSDATSAAQGIAGFADAFAGIKDTFFAIKHIVDLAKDANKMTSQEKFKASMEIISDALSAAKSGVSSAKAFYDLWGGGAGAPLVNAVPGLGIALCAVDIIVRAVDLVSALVWRHRMQARKRELKTGGLLGGVKGTTLKPVAEAYMRDIDAKRERGEAVTDDEEERYAAYEEYLLSKGLQYISSKRANRAVLKISVAMGKMAGDVAVLGGASAPVGIGIKGGAMAVDVGASLFRRFKQWGRDKAATRAAGGQTGGFFSMFNADKSTAKKLAGYNRMIDKIFTMIVKAVQIADPTQQGVAMARVESFVGAMGLSISHMHRLKARPAELRMAMIVAMKKRE